jgi:hypothetical protein
MVKETLLSWLGRAVFPDLTGESDYLQDRKAKAEQRAIQRDRLVSLKA